MTLDPKKAIADIKKLLGFNDAAAAGAGAGAPAGGEGGAAAPTGTEYKLQDGTTVCIDKLEVGGIVKIADAVAPDGAYTLEDGTALTVTAGVISAVTPPVATEPLNEEMKTPQQMQAAINKFADDVAAGTAPDMGKVVVLLKAVFENVFGWQLRQQQEQAAIATYQSGFTKIEQDLANQKEANKLLMELLEQFADDSKDEPAEQPKDWDDMTALEKRRFAKAQK